MMISLLVPTMNRSEFLIRLIRYYYDNGFEGCLFIGDSSNEEELTRTKEAISKYGDRFNIVHKEYPGFTNAQCTQALLKSVTTPYCAFLGDDDFLTVGGLKECVNFLEENLNFSAAHGKAIIFNLKQSGAYGEIDKTIYYELPEILDRTASARLQTFLIKGGVPMFSIFRTDVFRMMFENIHLVNDMSLSTEVLPCCLSAIAGKNKKLNNLMLVRQLHEEQHIYVPDRFDWITSSHWGEAFNTLKNIAADELVRHDDITVDDAREFVKQEYSYAFIKILGTKWHAKHGSKMRHQSMIAKMILFLHFITLSLKERPFILRVLLKPSSTYYNDFRGVREIIAPKEVV